MPINAMAMATVLARCEERGVEYATTDTKIATSMVLAMGALTVRALPIMIKQTRTSTGAATLATTANTKRILTKKTPITTVSVMRAILARAAMFSIAMAMVLPMPAIIVHR